MRVPLQDYEKDVPESQKKFQYLKVQMPADIDLSNVMLALDRHTHIYIYTYTTYFLWKKNAEKRRSVFFFSLFRCL